jgi:hypothetical protein
VCSVFHALEVHHAVKAGVAGAATLVAVGIEFLLGEDVAAGLEDHRVLAWRHLRAIVTAWWESKCRRRSMGAPYLARKGDHSSSAAWALGRSSVWRQRDVVEEERWHDGARSGSVIGALAGESSWHGCFGVFLRVSC